MTTIQEFYDIKYTKEIGRGASGKVYYASRKHDGLNTAVKVISRTSLNHDNLKAILNEIRTLKDLDHPNIVKLYDMFEDKRFFYLAMEYIQGGELFDRITKKTYYNEHDARELCKIILSAIKHLHERNIVHRDLKPENLLLNKDDDDTDVKLVDFGFCDTVGDGRMLSGIMGTPMYMAPEIWSEGPYAKPVDMWAFGVITYILLGGYPPFSEEKREKLIQHIQSGVFVFHEQYWNGVSDEAKDFITQCLNIDPLKRMTVDQALNHPWSFKGGLDKVQLENTLENLKDFNAKRRLKSAFSAVIAINRMNKLLGITNTLTASTAAAAQLKGTNSSNNSNNTTETEETEKVSEQNAEILSSYVKQYSIRNTTTNNNSDTSGSNANMTMPVSTVGFESTVLTTTIEDVEVDMNTTIDDHNNDDDDDDDGIISSSNNNSNSNSSNALRQSPSERRIQVQSIKASKPPSSSSSFLPSAVQKSDTSTTMMNTSNHASNAHSHSKAVNDDDDDDGVNNDNSMVDDNSDNNNNNNSNSNNDNAVANPCVIS